MRGLVPLVPLVLAGCGGVGLAATDRPETGDDSGTTGPGCFADRDGDGYGDPSSPRVCVGGAAAVAGDCDDLDGDRNPGVAETCDGVDEDCDGVVDEDPVDGLPFYVDGDGDGWGGATTTACTLGEGLVLAGGDCDDADATIHPEATERCDEVDQDCDGLAGDSVGASSECPAESCLAIAEAGGSGDGAYWLRLPSGTTAPVWCDLTTDGGGWTLGFQRNSAAIGNQGDFGAGEVGLDGLALGPAEASSTATPALAWIDLNAFPYTTLRVGAWASGAATWLSRDIPRTELRIAFGDDGYKLYGGTTGYYWCGGDSAYTDAGVGAVDNPAGATADCKGHGSLGSGWDFSEADQANAGLTLCGSDGSSFLAGSWGGTWTYYGTPGAAEVIWVR